MNAKARHRRRYRAAHAKPCPGVLRMFEREREYVLNLGLCGRVQAADYAASVVGKRHGFWGMYA